MKHTAVQTLTLHAEVGVPHSMLLLPIASLPPSCQCRAGVPLLRTIQNSTSSLGPGQVRLVLVVLSNRLI